jgi:primase-polymerase (primpol)-like protein
MSVNRLTQPSSNGKQERNTVHPDGGTPAVRKNVYGAIEAALADYLSQKRWVCWRSEFRHTKVAKVPVEAKRGIHASVTCPDQWVDYPTCLRFWQEHAHASEGIGIVLTGDGLVGIDLDNCRNPSTRRSWRR